MLELTDSVVDDFEELLVELVPLVLLQARLASGAEVSGKV